MTGIVKNDDVKKHKEEAEKNWWKRLIIRKRSISLFTTISITIGISTLIALVYVVHHMKPEITLIKDIHFQYEYPQGTDDKKENICTSTECIHTASRVLKYMNKSIDPCDNFYDFACGSFVKNINVPKYSREIDSFDNLETIVLNQLIYMVEEPIQNDEPLPFQLIKKLYKVCIDENSIEIQDLEIMKRILDYLGGWPVLDGDSWAEADFNWNHFDHNLANLGYGSSYFLSFDIDRDSENSTNTIYVGKPAIRKLSNETQKYMVDTAVRFGADPDIAKVELKESVEFELKLNDNYMQSENYISMTIQQLEENFPSIPWREYMADLSVTDTLLAKNDMVFKVYRNFITEFENIIDKTPKRVQANYLMWRVIADSVQYLPEELNTGNPEYISPFPEDERRCRECLEQTISCFPVAFEAMYVRKYFSEYAKQTTEEMVDDIRTEFYDILKKVDWMDEETRKYALEKASAMVAHIAYPEELMDIAKLEEYYKGLEIDTDNYLLSILAVNKFTRRNFRHHLIQTVDETYRKWNSKSYSLSTYYSLNGNSYELPAGSLQGSFFDVQRPKYMNYGAIGYIFAANIIGGFNEEGSLYDKNGNRMGNWWQNQTRTVFKEKSQCFFNPYGQSHSPDINLYKFIIDNIFLEDNGGIRIAYLAYRHWLETNGVEPKLPGLDFTPQQMFWISAANMWCAKYDMIDEGLGSSLEEFRVSTFISNSEYFAKDFNCPKGSPMNPSKSCQIW